jgi:hypothetical protein
MHLKRRFSAVPALLAILACGDSTAPDPDGSRFAYQVSTAESTTSYTGGSASFAVTADPCNAEASLLRIDLSTSAGVRTTLSLRLGGAGVPTTGVKPFSVAGRPGVADVSYSDVVEIFAWRRDPVFLRLTGELRLDDVTTSLISGSFDFEAARSWLSPVTVDVRGTFTATVDPDTEPVDLLCEPSQPPTWPHRVEPAIIAHDVGDEPRVEVDVLGNSAVVGIIAFGTTNCHASAGSEVVVEGRTATVTPMNYNVLPGRICPRALSPRVSVAVVPFGQSGPAVIRVRGLIGTGSPDTIVVERSVAIP